MASTSTVTRSRPPTTNNLDAAQRARVMRSSRKLGAVLGTTPFLLESCGGTVSMSATLHPATKYRDARTPTRPSHVNRYHRKCSVLDGTSSDGFETSSLVSFSRVAASSQESLLHASNSSTEDLPAPMVLAARSQSKRAGNSTHPLVLRLNTTPDPRVQPIPVPLSPLSSNADVPRTPATPVELSRAEARRRKMARVVRTLGEKVPPELVFQPSDIDWSAVSPVSPVSVTTTTSSSLMPHDTRSISRSGSTTKLTRSRPRSSSLGSSPQWQRLLELPAPVFSSSTRAPQDQQWVGAWNRRNIAQVQRELRTLRRR